MRRRLKDTVAPRMHLPMQILVVVVCLGLSIAVRWIARRLAKDVAGREVDEDAAPDVLAQVQAEAASTWRELIATRGCPQSCGRLTVRNVTSPRTSASASSAR